MKQNFAKIPFVYYLQLYKSMIWPPWPLMQGRPSRRVARYGFVNNKQMTLLQNFVSQQLLFLFSKHLDTMSNVTDCGTGQTDLCKKAAPTTPIKILVGTSEGSVQVWDLKSQRLEETLPIFEKEFPILWIGTYLNEENEEEILVQARFATTLKILDSNFSNCKSTTIQQAVPHFCKGDIFQNWIIALPDGESNCDIFLTKKFETSKSIINDHSKEGNLMSMKLSEKYFYLGFESGILIIPLI